MKKMLASALMTLSTISSYGQQVIDAPSYQYQIVNTQTNALISIEELAESVKDKNIVLFGEEHNDTIAHWLQLRLAEELNKLRNGNIALSFEMWERDVQNIMDEYLNDWIREKNFIKESRAWSNYEDYKPLVDLAKTNKIPVICANTPARYTNMVTRGQLTALNKLPKCVKKNFLPPLPVSLLTGKYQEKFNDILGGHATPGVYMYESQNLWDATMAHSIYSFYKKNKDRLILHFNGRFHSDDYEGVTSRILDKMEKKSVATISAFADQSYNPALHKGIADYVIITKLQKPLIEAP